MSTTQEIRNEAILKLIGADTPTPGDWHWFDRFGRKDGRGSVRRNLYGDVFDYAVADDDGFVVATCSGPLVTMTSARSEANARLVAAAPDLLKALRGMLDWARRVRGLNPGMEVADAQRAIAKATGGDA